MRDNIKGGALTETTFFILLALLTPNHGYGIMQFIENETDGRLVLGAGTLYGAINTQLKKGWIIPYGTEDSSSKKQYIITSEGKQIVENEVKRIEQLHLTALKIIKGGLNNDEKNI